MVREDPNGEIELVDSRGRALGKAKLHYRIRTGGMVKIDLAQLRSNNPTMFQAVDKFLDSLPDSQIDLSSLTQQPVVPPASESRQRDVSGNSGRRTPVGTTPETTSETTPDTTTGTTPEQPESEFGPMRMYMPSRF